MRGRLARASLAAFVLTALLTPLARSAGAPGQELEDTKRKLEGIRKRIQAHEAEAGSLRQRIDRLDGDIRSLQIEINRLGEQRAEVESEVRDAEAAIRETEAHIGAIERRATHQAVLLYKSGSTDVLDALLDSKSLRELDERVAFLGVAARKNTGFLVRYGRLRLEVEDQHKELFAQKERLEGVLESQARILDEERRLRASLAADLSRLKEQLGAEKAEEGDLEKDAAALTSKIVAAQATAPVRNVGRSASGFIWPLNGPVTSGYGYRWGRMHTGIDIDGYTGQPIVASKGGRVILAGYNGGYGNSVSINHGGGVATLYAHLSSAAVSVGQSVSQGQVVGRVGCTGSCTGDHLHFEVRVNGRPVNPMAYLP